MRIICIILLLTHVCLFSTEQQTNEESSQTLRLSQNLWPHCILRLSVQLKLENSSFWAGLMIKIVSLKATNMILVNISTIQIYVDINVVEVVENQRYCLSINKSKTFVDDEILTIIVNKQLKAFGIYEVYIPFRIYLDPKMTWSYQSNSHLTSLSTNWLQGNQTDLIYSNCTFSSNQPTTKSFIFSVGHEKTFKASINKSFDDVSDNSNWMRNWFTHKELTSRFFTIFISEFGSIETLPPLESPIELLANRDDSNFSMKIIVDVVNYYLKNLNFKFAPTKIDPPKVYPTQPNQNNPGYQKQDIVTVLQINVNHSSFSQHLALSTARKINAKVIIISEPYLTNRKLSSTPSWLQVYVRKTAILIDETLSYTSVAVNSTNTVAIEIKNVLIISTYLSPNNPVEEEFLILQNLLDTERRVILAGDFNCRHAKFTDQKMRERDELFQEFIQSHGLGIANKKMPTLEHQGRLSINDYTLYKRVDITDWRVLELESLSDHKYIAYKINLQRYGRRTTREVDEERVEELLKSQQLKFDDPKSRASCNQLATTLTNFLSNLTETCTVERAILPKSLYWNDELEVIYRTLIQLKKKQKRTGIFVFKKIIRILERDFKGMIREAKRKAWKNFDIQNLLWGQPPKIKFKNFRRALQLIPDETLLLKRIGQKLPSTVAQVEELQEVTVDCVTEAEVTQIFKSMPNRTKPGPDGINFKTLKMLHKIYPTILPGLFTACLRFRIFPDAWKKGKVIWFSKPNKDPSSSDGYRPITLLSALGNVFEKSIVNRMKAHIQQNDILSPRQFGFVPQKGKDSCIKSLLTNIRDLRHSYDFVALVKSDIEAAFDSLSWDHMMGQLRKYKFPTYLIELIASYLENRVVTSGTASIILEKGCPQGSVLGPLLWTVSYNYLLDHFMNKSLSVFCYADDTAFVLGATSQQNLIEKIRSTILETEELISQAGLKLSLPKTAVMIFNRTKHEGLLEFEVADKKIEISKSLKYLGIIIDSELN